MFGVFEGTKVELFFSLPYVQYVSLTTSNKFQFSGFSLLRNLVEKSTKSTVFLHIGFFIPLSPVYAGMYYGNRINCVL